MTDISDQGLRAGPLHRAQGPWEPVDVPVVLGGHQEEEGAWEGQRAGKLGPC